MQLELTFQIPARSFDLTSSYPNAGPRAATSSFAETHSCHLDTARTVVQAGP